MSNRRFGSDQEPSGYLATEFLKRERWFLEASGEQIQVTMEYRRIVDRKHMKIEGEDQFEHGMLALGPGLAPESF